MIKPVDFDPNNPDKWFNAHEAGIPDEEPFPGDIKDGAYLDARVALRSDSNTQYGPRQSESGLGRGHTAGARSGRRRRSRTFIGPLCSSATFMGTMQPPEYLIDGLLLAGCAFTLTGKTGHGKTLLAMAFALAVATGNGFCGRLCCQGSVAFFAGENPDNVKMQWYSMCADIGVDPTSLPVYWYEGVFDLDEARERLKQALRGIPDLRLCIFDSLQAFFTGDDDNQNMAMLDAAIDFRELSEGHPMRPVSLILAHPVKNVSRDNLLPRGGGSLTNELDGNLTVWLDGEIATLHHHGKFRGIPFEPIQGELVVIKPKGLIDAHGLQMSCTVLRAIMPGRANELSQQRESRRIIALRMIKADPKVTTAAIGAAFGQSQSTGKRMVNYLIEAGWIKRSGSRLVLTKDGTAELDDDEN